ncbi:OLC1v1036903C1 [Oldenlandia corymbosa var. corymbosa]|uniref:OLC1v1036903C1 n=1 Tax=Oldenlandia corymbosa var. corymbosa TaxID=529605 RepID=A0AAV1CWB6_OLDCO|nr:OLC1v1036903C1 [Oldenlandia corymbosa var. corymbosa]
MTGKQAKQGKGTARSENEQQVEGKSVLKSNIGKEGNNKSMAPIESKVCSPKIGCQSSGSPTLFEKLCKNKVIEVGECSDLNLKLDQEEVRVSEETGIWEKFDPKKLAIQERKLAYIESAKKHDKVIAKVHRDEIQDTLSRFTSTIGKPMEMDEMTIQRDRTGYARVLVEMEIQEKMPTELWYEDEHGIIQSQKICYEWKPVKCAQCKGYGHETAQCKKVKPVAGQQSSEVVGPKEEVVTGKLKAADKNHSTGKQEVDASLETNQMVSPTNASVQWNVGIIHNSEVSILIKNQKGLKVAEGRHGEKLKSVNEISYNGASNPKPGTSNHE